MIISSVVFMHRVRENRLAQGLTQKQLAARIRNCGYQVTDRDYATSEKGWRAWRIADNEGFRIAVSHALGVSRVCLLSGPVPHPCNYCQHAGTVRPCEACGRRP